MALREERLINNLTQEELARLTDVTTSTIQKAEKNNNCSLYNAYKISQVLKKPIEEIFFK